MRFYKLYLTVKTVDIFGREKRDEINKLHYTLAFNVCVKCLSYRHPIVLFKLDKVAKDGADCASKRSKPFRSKTKCQEMAYQML
jgi:hypothetical protein